MDGSLRISCSTWVAVIVLAVCSPAFAQDAAPLENDALIEVGIEPEELFDDEVETDRDSFTPATTVVGTRRFVVESSYSFIDNRIGAESHSFPELLTRIGISEKMELRFGWNYEMGGGGSVSNSGSPSEDEPLASGSEEEGTLLYGLKVLVSEQDVWRPQSAVILQGYTPTAGPANDSQLSAGYVFGWTLPNDWVLDSALRYALTSEEGDHFNLWMPSVVLKVPVAEKWKAHVEYFGIFTQKRENERGSQYFSPGIHYLITPDLEVGVRVGWGLNDDSAKFFSNIGVGRRF